MESDSHQGILRAIRVCMRPIAEFLLQAGVGYRQFEKVAKLAFAETAIKKYGIRGRETNISRVSVMTGISRKELTKLRDELGAEGSVPISPPAPASLVLSGWYTDKEFLGVDGTPALLPYEGQPMSFVELVRRYAGDVPAGAVRAELKRSGSIDETVEGLIRPLRRYFVPREHIDRLASSVEVILAGLAATISHNSNPARVSPGYIERFVFSDRLPTEAMAKFRLLARERSSQLLEELDTWLAENDVPGDSSGENLAHKRVGLGVFYYEGDTGVNRGDGATQL